MSDRNNKPLITSVGPNTGMQFLYRARVFQSDIKLKIALARPDKNLGSPPSALAISGRMNARGISVFYGANDLHAAISEVRPPVGSQVATARFEIIRPLRLLDLKALGHLALKGSIFNENYIKLLERAMFLRNLSHRISAPIMPDQEGFDYIPTQAIADFLSQSSISLDGIIYPSVQVAGEKANVVLFHKSSKVESLKFQAGTKIEVGLGDYTDDGWERNYMVSEVIRKTLKKKSKPKSFFDETMDLCAILKDAPNNHMAALRVDLDSVKVHLINSISFKSEEYDVHRIRYQETDMNDSTPRINDW